MVAERAQERNGYVLDVRDLSVSYHTAAGPVRAVNGVSLFRRPGERLGLVGESGSGKTTTALSLMRLLQESAVIEGGQVLLDGRPLEDLPVAERASHDPDPVISETALWAKERLESEVQP